MLGPLAVCCRENVGLAHGQRQGFLAVGSGGFMEKLPWSPNGQNRERIREGEEEGPEQWPEQRGPGVRMPTDWSEGRR